MTDVKKNENMTFEEAMKGLESIVSKLALLDGSDCD